MKPAGGDKSANDPDILLLLLCLPGVAAWVYWIGFHVSSDGISFELEFIDQIVAVGSLVVGEGVLATKSCWRFKLWLTLFNLTYPAFILACMFSSSA